MDALVHIGAPKTGSTTRNTNCKLTNTQSMIINHQYKFIFLKTRKTAGTSTEIALSEFCKADDVITRIGEADEVMRQNLGFRGPQNYQCQGIYDYPEPAPQSNEGEVREFYNHIPAHLICKYVSDRIWNTYFKFCFERNPFDKAISWYYFQLQKYDVKPGILEMLDSTPPELLSSWWIYTIEDQLAVDFVGRYETLNEDLEKIRTQLGMPKVITLPWAKSQFRQDKRHYRDILPPACYAIIETVCAKELAYFNYAR